MVKKLFVGSLSFNTSEDSLKTFFAQAGTVQTATIVMDRETGRSKGFGFVEMSTDEEATNAIANLNGKELDGRTLTVNEARPKTDRPAFGGGGNRSGGGFRKSYQSR